jgi:hypothetical protein
VVSVALACATYRLAARRVTFVHSGTCRAAVPADSGMGGRQAGMGLAQGKHKQRRALELIEKIRL